MDSGGFGWSWDALVAIGTIGLAVGTFLLALSTRATAKATAEDVRSQWRPAVGPGDDAVVSAEFDGEVLSATVRNVGRGAAFFLEPALGLNGSYYPAEVPKVGREGRNLAILRPNEELPIYFALNNDEEPSAEAELLIDYADVNGRPYSTRFVLRHFSGDSPGIIWRMYEIELSDNRERIPWKPWTWEPSNRREWVRQKLKRPSAS